METEKGSGRFQCATVPVTFEKTGTYYFSMQSANEKKNGNASRHVTVGILGASTSAALSMPEEDSLGISDAPSFGQYDVDVLAGASASALAELDDKTGWQSLPA